MLQIFTSSWEGRGWGPLKGRVESSNGGVIGNEQEIVRVSAFPFDVVDQGDGTGCSR